MDFGIVIPSRFASSRLPGKPLRLIGGKPMIAHVMENAATAGAKFVWVATDDERIARVVADLGGEAVMTAPEHQTGTDRLAEVVKKRGVSGDTIIVNVQGDEPLLPTSSVTQVAGALSNHTAAQIATMAHPLSTVKELFDPNAVKVVLDEKGFALYFSRAPIPWVRDAFAQGIPQELPPGVPFLRHLGLYAYRASALTSLSTLSQGVVEKAESLEQLRALDAGMKIHVTVVEDAPAPGVDTEEDLQKVEKILLERQRAS